MWISSDFEKKDNMYNATENNFVTVIPLSLLCIKLMSKHCEVLLSFGPINFYNDSGWATPTHPETHAQNIES